MPIGAYQSSGGDIGTLLRLIQEDKSSGILNAPPAADPNSPIRQQTQGPLLAPEAPGGTRNVSLRPEGIGSVGPDGSGVVAPNGVMSSQPGTVVAAARPVAPVSVQGAGSQSTQGGGSPMPSFSSPQTMSRSAAPMPSIGTRISGSVLGSQASKPNLIQALKTSAAPAQKAKAPTKTPTRSNSFVGAAGTISSVATKILPAFGESLVGKLLKVPFGMVDYKGIQRGQAAKSGIKS